MSRKELEANMSQSLIVALDFPGKQDVEQFLRHFEGEELFVKVGMELFYKEACDYYVLKRKRA